MHEKKEEEKFILVELVGREKTLKKPKNPQKKQTGNLPVRSFYPCLIGSGRSLPRKGDREDGGGVVCMGKQSGKGGRERRLLMVISVVRCDDAPRPEGQIIYLYERLHILEKWQFSPFSCTLLQSNDCDIQTLQAYNELYP